MEESGGEPSIFIRESLEIIIVDLSTQTPVHRRNICYDYNSRINRKKFPPSDSAIEIMLRNNLEIVDEQLYLEIQTKKKLDLKTSTWLYTPSDIRNLGGGIFGDRRFDRVFIYHNGVDSYYATRGFGDILNSFKKSQ